MPDILAEDKDAVGDYPIIPASVANEEHIRESEGDALDCVTAEGDGAAKMATAKEEKKQRKKRCTESTSESKVAVAGLLLHEEHTEDDAGHNEPDPQGNQ